MAPFALDGSGGIMKLVGAIEIAALDAVEIAVEPWTWPFAQARRADIDRHFAARQRERPALWNGHSAAASLRAGEWRFAWGELRDRLCKLPGLARLGSSRSRRGQCRRRRCAAIGRWCLSVWSDGARLPVDGSFRVVCRTQTISPQPACSILPTTWVANCLRRLALILALAKSIRAGRRCATAGSSP